MNPIEVPLLSQADIIQLDLSPDDLLGAVEQAMRERSAGTYEMHPKIGVHPTGTDPDNFIHAMPAYLKQLGACGLKWVGGFARNPSQGLPNVTAFQACNDLDTGIPQAVMDCAYTEEALHQADKFIVDDIPLVEYFQKRSNPVGWLNGATFAKRSASHHFPPRRARLRYRNCGVRNSKEILKRYTVS